MQALQRYFFRCYHSGRLALLPPKGTLAVVFDGKQYGEKLLVHYNQDDSFISPPMSELKIRKELTNLPEKDKLTRRQQWQYDLSHISELLPMRHPNLFFQLPKKEFREQIDHIGKNVSEMCDVEIFLSLCKVFTRIGDSHTLISLPDELVSMYPLELYWFKDGLFVLAADRRYERALKARLVKIGQADIGTIYKAVSTIIPYENPWQLRKESPYPIRMPKMLEGLGLVTQADSNRLTFETASGRRFVLDVEAIPVARLRQIEWTYALDRTDPALPVSLQKRKGWYWYEYLEPSATLYFQYNRCREMREKPIAELTKELLNLVNSSDVDKFIFDIRYNGGGSSPVIEPLVKAIAASKVNRPGKPGHFGQVENMFLPYSKMRIQHSTKYCGRRDIDASTMTPDIQVEFSSEDFFAGRDPVLDAVLAYKEQDHKALADN
jgi:hypothetical protein